MIGMTGQLPSLPWIDDKYVMLLSHNLDKFKVVSSSPLVVNCRCPLCGDSAKSKTKTRGYFFRTPNGTRYKCHNCAASQTLRSFLKNYDQALYKEYSAEVFREVGRSNTYPTIMAHDIVGVAPMTAPKPEVYALKRSIDGLAKLTSILDLPPDHPAKAYWMKRRLPAERASDAYWCDAYYAWVNENIEKDKFDKELTDCGRVVFPFRDKNKFITGFTARAIGKEKPKYVAIKTADDVGAFGMERVNLNSLVKIVEGPIDSLFLKNCIAMGTSNKKFPEIKNKVFVYDNEPRSKLLHDIMQKAINAGETVVVWPSNVKQKDINEMVLAGLDPEAIIAARSFRGIRANIELRAWQK